jgi:hypothetical protein
MRNLPQIAVALMCASVFSFTSSPLFAEKADLGEVGLSILRLRFGEKWTEDTAFKNSEKFAALMDEISSTPLKQQLQTCVSLTDYVWDGAGAEALREKITGFGEIIVPLLVEKRASKIQMLDEFKAIKRAYTSVEERNNLIDSCLGAIRDGVILYKTFPKDLYDSENARLSTLSIFIEEYLREFGKLPDDLQKLRQHVFEKYSFVLNIHNPYGRAYGYIRRSQRTWKLNLGEDGSGNLVNSASLTP